MSDNGERAATGDSAMVFRLVLEDGTEQEVLVTHESAGYFTARQSDWHGFLAAATARGAATKVGAHGRGGVGWPVREVLAPGEQSADERVASMRDAAFAEGAIRMRERAAMAAHAVPSSVLPRYVRDQARDDIGRLPTGRHE